MATKEPHWYQDAIIYELHIRAFFDSNNDGSGDFRGLVQKLDYLQDLGVTAIWLLPFYPSPLKDDGYDIADYKKVNTAYGNLSDFKLFLREAHKRGLHVITELVMNHTSDQHPWFQRARKAKPDSSFRDFYVWSDTPDRYKEVRIIFQDFEHSNWTWDAVAHAYYWHRFYSHQPDLNFQNPLVHNAIQDAVDFWLKMGVDGLRLDAIPYLYEQEGTNCESLPETHAFLRKIRKHIDENFSNRMLLAEANQWPEDAIHYFGNDDECHMAFHFPVMPRMYMGLHMEDRFPIVDILEQTPEIPSSCHWSIFLRNHDELTLEMVTDEERDYMYRVYANDPQARVNVGIRRRLAPLLDNNRRKIELMNALLFSLPGTPVIYYGDEIGMGDNYYLGDRNAVRTPMQWSSDRNAGFSRAHPHQLFLPIIIDPEYHYESVNVETQQNNTDSLLWWMKKLLALRKKYRALGLGKLKFLHPDNSKVLSFVAEYEEEKILIVVNLSRFTEYVQLDLSEWTGLHLLELFGHAKFPMIKKIPYLITLGAHSFYWFLIEQSETIDSQILRAEKKIPVVEMGGEWQQLFKESQKYQLENLLPEHFIHQDWFDDTYQAIKSTQIIETILVNESKQTIYMLLVEITSRKEEQNIYFLPLTFVKDSEIESFINDHGSAILVQLPNQGGYLVDAFYHPKFKDAIITAISSDKKFKGNFGTLFAKKENQFNEIKKGNEFLKLYRHCNTGISPEFEVNSFLSDKINFSYTPKLGGFLEYQGKSGHATSIGILQNFIQYESNASKYMINHINRFFEEIITHEEKYQIKNFSMPKDDYFFKQKKIPQKIEDLLYDYIYPIRLLGQCTAEMHIALGSEKNKGAFSPEEFSISYQRTLYQSIRGICGRTLVQLRKAAPNLPEKTQVHCDKIIQSTHLINQITQKMLLHKFSGQRIRCHNNFQLENILHTGKEFALLNFEGETDRPLSERRSKRSPLRDLATMMYSFNDTIQKTMHQEGSIFRQEDLSKLQNWAAFINRWMSVYFCQGYFETIDKSSLLPNNESDFFALFKILSLEKSLYEIRQDLKNRPEWLPISCQTLLDLI